MYISWYVAELCWGPGKEEKRLGFLATCYLGQKYKQVELYWFKCLYMGVH